MAEERTVALAGKEIINKKTKKRQRWAELLAAAGRSDHGRVLQ